MIELADYVRARTVFVLSLDVTRYLGPELAVDGFLTIELRDWARRKILSSSCKDKLDFDVLQSSLVEIAYDEFDTSMMDSMLHWQAIAFPEQDQIAKRWMWMILFQMLSEEWEKADRDDSDPLSSEDYAWVRVLVRQRLSHSRILSDEVDRLLEGPMSEWDKMVESRYSDWFDIRSAVVETADTIAAVPLWTKLLSELPDEEIGHLLTWAVDTSQRECTFEKDVAFPSV